VAPLTEAVSGMSVNTLLRELAETPGFRIFIPGFARNLGGTEKKTKKHWDLPTHHSLREAVFDPGWLLWTTVHLAIY